MAKDSSPSGRQLAASCDQNSKLEALQSFDDSKESEDGPDRSKTASAAHSKGDEGSNGDTELHIPTRSPSMNSIYGLYSNRRRNCILLAAAFASVVVPFSDTVYLPALPIIQQDLTTSAELVATSVSIYMFVVGLASLVVGPAADRYGRLPTYLVSTVVFIGATIGCIFSHTAEVLVGFRALQGAGVAAFMTTGSAVIADIFPPENRGTASGIYVMPHLIGPVLGPLLGGAMSQAWGWRSTFILLAVLAVLAGIVVVAGIRTETHQYFVLKRYAKKDPAAARELQEWDEVTSQKPVFHAPWVPLKYLVEASIWPHALVGLVTLAAIFGVLTELPGALAHAPYSLPAGLIGVSYLADGLPSLIFAPVGGWMSDKSAAKHPGAPEARLVYNTLITWVFSTSGLIMYAWAMHYQTHLVAVYAGMILTALGCAVYMPAVFAYLTTLKQSAAAAASAAVTSMMFLASGVIILVSAVATKSMGYGPWFTLLGGLQFLVTGNAFIIILHKQRAAARREAAARQEPQV